MSIQCPYLFVLCWCHTEGSDTVADALVSLPTLPRPDTKRAEGYTQNKFTPYPGGSEVKNPPAKQREGNATHSIVLAWEIPWTEEPGGLQSMGSQRVRYDLVTKTTTPQSS